MVSPSAELLSADPILLLIFSTDKETSLNSEPYNLTGNVFLERGHRVLSFDLPNHGRRIDQYGEGIVGLRNAFVQGHDPFCGFVTDASAVIDCCIAEGLARSRRIVVAGTSRAAYLAMRLLAGEARIAAGAAIAPVTDWLVLNEFQSDLDNQAIAELRLSRYVESLAGKPIYIAIGNHDQRVGTSSCCQFYLDLCRANVESTPGFAGVDLHVDGTPGHFSNPRWHIESAEVLLSAVSSTS